MNEAQTLSKFITSSVVKCYMSLTANFGEEYSFSEVLLLNPTQEELEAVSKIASERIDNLLASSIGNVDMCIYKSVHNDLWLLGGLLARCTDDVEGLEAKLYPNVGEENIKPVVYISSFNRVKLAPETSFKVSTAVGTPPWFFTMKNSSNAYGSVADKLKLSNIGERNIKCECMNKSRDCATMELYRSYLHSIDLYELISTTLAAARSLYPDDNFDSICLLVWEELDALCSERFVLKDCLLECGFNVKDV